MMLSKSLFQKIMTSSKLELKGQWWETCRYFTKVEKQYCSENPLEVKFLHLKSYVSSFMSKWPFNVTVG